MKIKTRGFSAIELILVVVVIAVIGLFVYFVSKNKSTDVQTQNQPVPATQNNVTDQEVVSNYVKQLVSEAEATYNGSYSPTFSSSNSSRSNGSGIVSKSGSAGSNVVSEVASKGGSVFVITNDKASKYAVYGTMPNLGAYVCMASDGSKKDLTATVIDITGLSANPICK